jgi:hypothetical protein
MRVNEMFARKLHFLWIFFMFSIITMYQVGYYTTILQKKTKENGHNSFWNWISGCAAPIGPRLPT